MVVNRDGKRRFIYIGPPLSASIPFKPVGITTDSHSRILTSDFHNYRIHIMDQNGQFLQYINDLDISCPWGLCVDTQDNLFVAEKDTHKIKKIHYYIT